MYKVVYKIIADFDGTITFSELPFYTIIKECGIVNVEDFFDEVSRCQEINNITFSEAYFLRMFELVEENNIVYSADDFSKYAKEIKYMPGVYNFFSQIKKDYPEKVESHIVTAGLVEYIEELEISKFFKGIHGSRLSVSNDGIVLGMKEIVETQDKIAIIERIIEESKVSGENIIYIGDGLTDIPAMEKVTEIGGTTILICKKGVKSLDKRFDSIVNYYLDGDYQNESELYRIVMEIINS